MIMTLRVYFLDKHFKTFEYHPATTTSELVQSIAQAMNIACPEYFGLYLEYSVNGKPQEQALEDDDYVIAQSKSRTESKLVFKSKFFKEDRVLNSDERSTHLFYAQIKKNIVSGEYPCPFHTAVKLAGVQLNIDSGFRNVNKENHGILLAKLSNYFSQEVLQEVPIQVLEKHFVAAYESVPPLPWFYLKKLYLLEALSLPTFGAEFFRCRQTKFRNLPFEVTLGVKPTGLLLITTGNVFKEWTFGGLAKWGYTYNTFLLQLKTNDRKTGLSYEFLTAEAARIYKLLNAYADTVREELTVNEDALDKQAVKIQALWRGAVLRNRLRQIRKTLAVHVIESFIKCKS